VTTATEGWAPAQYVDAHLPRFLDELADYCRIPSWGGYDAGMDRGAEISHELSDKNIQLIHVKSGNLCRTHLVFLLCRALILTYELQLAGQTLEVWEICLGCHELADSRHLVLAAEAEADGEAGRDVRSR